MQNLRDAADSVRRAPPSLVRHVLILAHTYITCVAVHNVNPNPTLPCLPCVGHTRRVSCGPTPPTPPTQRTEAAGDVMEAMKALQEAGNVPKWGAVLDQPPARCNVFLGELKRVGIKDPQAIGTPSTRNEASFLFAVVMSTSLVAVVAGVVLPGDWGFFVPYLVGGISLGVLAVGSVAPGLLQVAIDKFGQVQPDYRERVLRHEAAHFLVCVVNMHTLFLSGPITSYHLLPPPTTFYHLLPPHVTSYHLISLHTDWVFVWCASGKLQLVYWEGAHRLCRGTIAEAVD